MTFTQYLNELLTKEEEELLLKNIKSENKQDRNKLVESYLPLVLKIASPYRKTWPSSFEDIVHEGILGLILAVEKFDPSKNSSFYSFSSVYIRNSIFQFLRKNSGIFHIPNNIKYQSIKLKKFIQAYSSLEGKEPSLEEMCVHMQCAPRRIKQLQGILSYSPGEYLQSQKIKIKDERINLIRDKMESLDSINREIILLRNGEDSCSWREIGKKLNLSHETVRRRYFSSIKILKVVIKTKRN
jgi:RNA polymerase primary sigma factor